MTYEEARKLARDNMGGCYACAVCNGQGCRNAIPGPGAKGTGTVAIRNYDAWQKIYLNMDTIAPDLGVDTSIERFGERFELPVFSAPSAPSPTTMAASTTNSNTMPSSPGAPVRRASAPSPATV